MKSEIEIRKKLEISKRKLTEIYEVMENCPHEQLLDLGNEVRKLNNQINLLEWIIGK